MNIKALKSKELNHALCGGNFSFYFEDFGIIEKFLKKLGGGGGGSILKAGIARCLYILFTVECFWLCRCSF